MNPTAAQVLRDRHCDQDRDWGIRDFTHRCCSEALSVPEFGEVLCALDWWASSDSNREPNDYEPFALTIELEARRAVV